MGSGMPSSSWTRSRSVFSSARGKLHATSSAALSAANAPLSAGRLSSPSRAAHKAETDAHDEVVSTAASNSRASSMAFNDAACPGRSPEWSRNVGRKTAPVCAGREVHCGLVALSTSAMPSSLGRSPRSPTTHRARNRRRSSSVAITAERGSRAVTTKESAPPPSLIGGCSIPLSSRQLSIC